MKKIAFVRQPIAILVAVTIFIIACSALLGENVVGYRVSAQTDVPLTTEADETYSYEDYMLQVSKKEKAKEKIVVAGNAFVSEQDSGADITDYAGGTDVLYWKSGKGTITYQVEIENDALFNFALSFRPLDENASSVNIGIKIDGLYPYSELDEIFLSTVWMNETEKFSNDSRGNQLTPKQVMADGFFLRTAKDDTGIELYPYLIYLTAGIHNITLVSKGDAMAISSVVLLPPEDIKSYDDVSENYDDIGSINKEAPIVLQGENAVDKSLRSLAPLSDTISANVYPASAKYSLLNYIGGSSWSYAGDSLSWDFNIPKTGYYKIGFKYKQSVNINRSSYRWLKIDGITPFAEACEIEFPYSNSWKFMDFSDDENNDYMVWLEQGNHTLTMEVTLGKANAEYYRELRELSDEINDIYLDIVKITSTSPDVAYDYELFNQIPNLDERLNENYNTINSLINEMLETEENNTNEIVGSMRNMARVIKNMIDHPYLAQQYVKNYYSCFCTLFSCVNDMISMPLAIDEVQIVSKDIEFDSEGASFLDTISFRFSGFIYSFIKDYEVPFDSEKNDVVTVWVSSGRDQASALESLIRESFSESTGIEVNLRVVNSSLVNGIISGKYPDVQLNVTRSEPVNLGIRGAVCDLSDFEDFDEVLERFQEGAEQPYCFRNACFALPDTQTFFIMFYRTDIFEKLDLKVPETWDEFLNVASTVQRNNMEVYVPYTKITTEATVNTGIGSLHLFPTLMIQSNLSLYNETRTATTLSQESTINIFEYWTKLYTDYKFQKEADFYNRFRTGIMPLGIAPYSTYFNFSEMAPEIQGKWSIALVPSFNHGENGVSGGGTGCVILEKSQNKDSAWEFLKWWTSADVQSEYSRRLESILGLLGRTTTSNVDAFKQLDWKEGMIDILLEQWKNVKEIPEVPGSYYLSRSVDQAYWAVVNGENNAVDALTLWSKSADEEIERKFQEYVEE